jgi:predicted HTH transcriptional regulator/pyrimidine deaminase RibD-like protein
MSFEPRKYMRMAIDEMKKSIHEPRTDDKLSPYVGAVLVNSKGELVGKAHRGEFRYGDHAEYTLIDRKFRAEDLTGLYLFATLEPCNPGSRNHPKLACSERIVNSRIKKVWVGIEDPDPNVCRKGIQYLEDSGIEVEMFDGDLQSEIKEVNKEYLIQAANRPLKNLESKKILLSYLENKIDDSSVTELSQEALQLYINRAKLDFQPESNGFYELLSQQGLLFHNEPSSQDEQRRIDVQPNFKFTKGMTAQGRANYSYTNIGGRVNVISWDEFEDNNSYINVNKGWIDTSELLNITASNKTGESDNSKIRFHFKLNYEDVDRRLFTQVFNFSNGHIIIEDPVLVTSSNSEYQPTGFGLLLFGKNPATRLPQSLIKAQINFKTGEPEIQDFNDALVLLPQRIETWLKRVIPSQISRENFTRENQFSYPIPVLREAIINAIIHRDYEIQGAKCYIIINEDSIVIKSPGLPVSPIKFDEFKKFKAPSLSRNPKLASIFSIMGFIEERGIGQSQMKSLPKDFGFPSPEITKDDLNTILTFSRKPIAPVSTKKLELSKEEQTGLDFVKSKGFVTKAQYAEHFNYDDKKAQRHLRKLKELGHVRTDGKSTATRYTFIQLQ